MVGVSASVFDCLSGFERETGRLDVRFLDVAMRSLEMLLSSEHARYSSTGQKWK